MSKPAFIYLFSVDGNGIETFRHDRLLTIHEMKSAAIGFAKGRMISPAGARVRDVTKENPAWIALLCGRTLAR